MTSTSNPIPVFSTSEPPASSEGQIPQASNTPSLPIVEPAELTFANHGQTVMLKTGSQLTLELTAGYAWTVTLPEQQVLRLVSESPAGQDNTYHGLFETLQPGQVELSATGEPFCRQARPACAIPSVLFKITIIVE